MSTLELCTICRMTCAPTKKVDCSVTGGENVFYSICPSCESLKDVCYICRKVSSDSKGQEKCLTFKTQNKKYDLCVKYFFCEECSKINKK